jgi:glucose-6-phosphate 1-epimerase
VQAADLIALETPEGHRAEVSLWGGQVLSWTHATQGPQLYCSPLRKAGQAIRGGVPVCFPQFASRGPLAKHGFARTSMWQQVHRSSQAGGAQARLRLLSSEETRAVWPHSFALTLDVTLSPANLTLTLSVENTGREPWPFTAALHTYVQLADVARASLHGLEGLTYEDACRGNDVATERHAHLSIDGEVDRVYRANGRWRCFNRALPTRWCGTRARPRRPHWPTCPTPTGSTCFASRPRRWPTP